MMNRIKFCSLCASVLCSYETVKFLGMMGIGMKIISRNFLSTNTIFLKLSLSPDSCCMCECFAKSCSLAKCCWITNHITKNVLAHIT